MKFQPVVVKTTCCLTLSGFQNDLEKLSFVLFFFSIKLKQLVISIKQPVIFIKSLTKNLFKFVVLENNLLFL